MDPNAKGRTIAELERRVEPSKLAELADAIGTETGAATASLTLFFGPTVVGEKLLVERLGLDLSKALLGGQSYSWTRPFRPDEGLKIRVFVEDVYEKGPMQFGIVTAEFRDGSGETIQTQRTTFLERK
jgi:acyl dehydratase